MYGCELNRHIYIQSKLFQLRSRTSIRVFYKEVTIIQTLLEQFSLQPIEWSTGQFMYQVKQTRCVCCCLIKNAVDKQKDITLI